MITFEQVCNHNIDCFYGSDEFNCEKSNITSKNAVDLDCQIFLKDEIKCKIRKQLANQQLNFEKFKNFKLINIENVDKLTNFQNSSILPLNYKLKYLKIKKFFGSVKILKILKNTPNLVSLILNENNLKFKKKIIKLKNLQYFDVSDNLINDTKFLIDLECDYLNYLDLSNNPISYLNIYFFKYLKIIKLNKIKLISIKNLNNYQFFNEIKMLFFINSRLSLNSTSSFFKSLNSLILFRGNSFQFCCLIWKFHGKFIDCQPNSDVYISCSRLLNNIYVQFIFWFYGLTGMISNFLSIILSIFFEQISVKYHRISINFSDFLTVFYTLSLSSIDLYYSETFIENIKNWKNSTFCFILGIIITFSLINSLLSLLNLTILRYIAIVHPFFVYKSKKISLFFIIPLNVFSIFLAILPFYLFKV